MLHMQCEAIIIDSKKTSQMQTKTFLFMNEPAAVGIVFCKAFRLDKKAGLMLSVASCWQKRL